MADKGTVSPFQWDVVFSYESIGFSLAKLWPFLVWFGYAGSAVLGDPVGVRSISHSLSLVALFVSLFAASLLSGRIGASVRVLAVSAASLDVVGAVMLMASAQMPDSPLSGLLCVLSALLTGVGSAFLNLCWGCSYSCADQKKAVGATAVAFLLWGFLFYSGQLLPLPLYSVFVIACPIASALIAVRAYDSACAGRQWRERLSFDGDIVKVVFGTVFFGLLSGIMFTIPLAASGRIPDSFPNSFFLASAIFFCVVLLAAKLRPKTFSFSRMYKSSTLVIVLAILLSPIFDWVFVAFLFGYVFFSFVVWIRATDISVKLDVSPVVVFGLAVGSLYLGLFMGDTLASQFLVQAYYADSTSKFVISIVIAAVALMASYLGLLDARSEGDAAKSAPSDPGDGLARACEAISRQYGLSARQSEILLELARGHSSKIIQETLLISAGTVNSHISAIYRKMGIHSRDELVRVVSKALGSSDGEAR